MAARPLAKWSALTSTHEAWSQAQRRGPLRLGAPPHTREAALLEGTSERGRSAGGSSDGSIRVEVSAPAHDPWGGVCVRPGCSTSTAPPPYLSAHTHTHTRAVALLSGAGPGLHVLLVRRNREPSHGSRCCWLRLRKAGTSKASWPRPSSGLWGPTWAGAAEVQGGAGSLLQGPAGTCRARPPSETGRWFQSGSWSWNPDQGSGRLHTHTHTLGGSARASRLRR